MTDYQTEERMAQKEEAIPLPGLVGKSVLDVGCDHGYWCWLSAGLGAERIVGLDRGRKVRGVLTDLAKRNEFFATEHRLPCRFYNLDLGHQWHEYGKFDVVLCFSMYHHVFENCGDHDSIWFWLWRHTSGELLWENPTGTDDPVVRMNVHRLYLRDEILKAAQRYFAVEMIGPALHVPTREVWRCIPISWDGARPGKIRTGEGGAAAAFEHAWSRRIDEIAHVLGPRMFPGSLNAVLDRPFDWDSRYYRSLILDLVNRRAGLKSEWAPRWARFYPCEVKGQQTWVFRFEGETYKENHIELISEVRLRGLIPESGRIDVRSS